MNKHEFQRNEWESGLPSDKAALLLLVMVPVLLSLALVATAVLFGRPVDAAEVLAGGPELTSAHMGESPAKTFEDSTVSVCGAHEAVLSPQVPLSDHGSDLEIWPESGLSRRAFIIGVNKSSEG